MTGTGLLNQIHHCFSGLNSRPLPQVFLTEVLSIRDPRSNSPEFMAAKQREIEGLVKRGTFEVVFKEAAPKGANIMDGRFVLAVKNKDTGAEIFKARYVVQGHTDKDKNLLVHSSTNLRQSSIRTITALAAIFGFRVWSQDVTQTYLQSDDKLMREVYIRPTKEFQLSSDQLLRLLKPLYGLADSGDHWNVTMAKHLKADLTMTPTALDISMFFKSVQGRLSGVTGVYVDDSLSAGNNDFLQDTDKTQAKFESREREFDNFTFAGVEVTTVPEGIRLHQETYAKNIHLLPSDCSFSQFRSAQMKLQWLVHTRPDIACATNRCAQVTEEQFCDRHIKELNKLVKRIRTATKRGLLQQKLDPETLHIRVYADSSFANNEDLSTQLGYLVLLCDARKRCNVLHYSSHKSRRTVRSVMGAKHTRSQTGSILDTLSSSTWSGSSRCQ